MRYVNWHKISSCTFEERNRMVPYIYSLIHVKYEVQKYGIYGFDEFLHTKADDFEKICKWLVTNGYSPEVCESVLFGILNSSKMDNAQYLKGAIFAEFVLTPQGKPIGILELRIILLAYLGIEFTDRILPGTPLV